MRKPARAIVVAVLAFLSAVVIGTAAILTAAITLAAVSAVGLVVPGTGTGNANIVANYKDNARDRYMTTTPCTVANGCTGANLIGINYPASFWPLGFPPFPSTWCPGLKCDTWNVSAGEGVAHLKSALITVLSDPTNPDIVIFGYSQGGAVVSAEMYNLASLPQTTKDRIKVVTIGNISNPQGLWARLSFLPTIQILNVTFGPLLPTDIGIESTNYVFEYDPVGDAPLNWWNPLALLNAVFALQYVHGNYLLPNGNDPTGTLPYGYTPETLAAAIQDPNNIRTYQDATFVLIPQKGTLPLFQPIADLAAATGTTPFVKPILDLISPVFKVLIDLGYDRTLNPGIPRTLNLIPIFNPIKLAVDLVVAAGEGIQAAWKDITGTAPALPAPFAPSGPSILAADNAAKLARTTEIEGAKPESQSPLKINPRDGLSPLKIDPLKIDPKPDADAGIVAPKTDPSQIGFDESLNAPFSLPKTPKPGLSAVPPLKLPKLPTLPKLPKPDDLLVPRVTDLLLKLRGVQNGQTTTDIKTDPGAGEQPGTPSLNNGSEAPAAA